MIQKGVRGNKRGRYQVKLMKIKIRLLLSEFKTNREIMDETGLKKRTFYRYKALIKEERLMFKRMMRSMVLCKSSIIFKVILKKENFFVLRIWQFVALNQAG
jgi:hypothetical protein